jgi:hypothetical protein
MGIAARPLRGRDGSAANCPSKKQNPHPEKIEEIIKKSGTVNFD